MLPEEDKCGIVDPEIEQDEDIEIFKDALVEEKGKAAKYLANWQRCQADFDNYKKHAEQEKNEIVEFANSTLILNLLPIMDDFERALASVPDDLVRSNWTEGINLICDKLKSTLELQGLVEIKANGEPFDPHLHEAIMQRDGDEGIIVEEIQKGYRFRDKVIRPSLVVVGNGNERGASNPGGELKWEKQ